VVLARHYQVTDAIVIRWLMELDLDAATNSMIA